MKTLFKKDFITKSTYQILNARQREMTNKRKWIKRYKDRERENYVALARHA